MFLFVSVMNSFGKARSLRMKMIRAGAISALESVSTSVQEQWNKENIASCVEGEDNSHRMLLKEVRRWIQMTQATLMKSKLRNSWSSETPPLAAIQSKISPVTSTPLTFSY